MTQKFVTGVISKMSKSRSSNSADEIPVRGRLGDSLSQAQASSSTPNQYTSGLSPTRDRSGRMRTHTQQCPFSFDERDSMRRVAREKRLEELRQTEVAIFRANPVRKYKPVVLKPSSRSLTISRTPFTNQDQ